MAGPFSSLQQSNCARMSALSPVAVVLRPDSGGQILAKTGRVSRSGGRVRSPDQPYEICDLLRPRGCNTLPTLAAPASLNVAIPAGAGSTTRWRLHLSVA
jgi:hypothetical protein